MQGLIQRLGEIPNKKNDFHSQNYARIIEQVDDAFDYAAEVARCQPARRDNLERIEESLLDMAQRGYSRKAIEIARGRYSRFLQKYIPKQ